MAWVKDVPGLSQISLAPITGVLQHVLAVRARFGPLHLGLGDMKRQVLVSSRLVRVDLLVELSLLACVVGHVAGVGTTVLMVDMAIIIVVVVVVVMVVRVVLIMLVMMCCVCMRMMVGRMVTMMEGDIQGIHHHAGDSRRALQTESSESKHGVRLKQRVIECRMSLDQILNKHCSTNSKSL